MPSVITTHSGIAASTASITAAFANLGGTKTTDTFAPVAAMASPTLLNTGMPSTSWPPLPGVTPATTLVPLATMRRVCLVPSEPVIPWTKTLLSALRKIAIRSPTYLQLVGQRDELRHPWFQHVQLMQFLIHQEFDDLRLRCCHQFGKQLVW